MGSYSNLRINGLEIYSVKREIDPTVMMLFTENDKRIRPFRAPDTSSHLPEEKRNSDSEPDNEEEWGDEPENIVEYAIPLSVAKDRLEFMGFTISKIRKEFHEGVNERLSELAERRKNPAWADSHDLQQMIEQEEQVLRSLTYEVWLDAFKNVLRTGLLQDRDYWYRGAGADELSPLLRYILGRPYDDMFGFPTYDTRVFIRGVAEIADNHAELVYDLTELVEGEYIEIDEDLAKYARWQMAEDFVLNHKVVVLTEGVSDCWALENALRLLYPHLADYYSFMDFQGARVPGGAGPLAATIKAFIGADIVNRIVAFFDNDTAAQSAMRSLRNIAIPKNVRILRYPDLELARNYPTLGPQGTTLMDINGLAGSIELYYGIDVLKDQDGNFTPIQWRGYEDSMKQYQGEITNKAELQSRFAEKIKKCQADLNVMQSYDWSGMRTILDCLRSAFHEA
jgi:hypothetical protein